MKCPLFWLGCITSSRQVKSADGNCLKEQCAWWSEKYGRCAILAYEAAWERLAETLRSIDSKIPLGGAK